MVTTGTVIATATSITAVGALAIAARVWIPQSPPPVADYRSAEDLNRACYSNNDTITCSLTNRSRNAAFTCMRASLKNKKTGATADPVSVCSGPIQPYETKTLTAQWSSFVAKLCPTEGMKNVPDWEACAFDAESFDPR